MAILTTIFTGIMTILIIWVVNLVVERRLKVLLQVQVVLVTLRQRAQVKLVTLHQRAQVKLVTLHQ